MTLLLLAAAFAGDVAASGTLEAAYQKEYAYLFAEKQELAERLAEIKADSASRIKAADAALTEQQTRLVSTTRLADRAEVSFDALERETSAMDDADALLSSTVTQASESLELPAPEDAAAALPRVFETASQRVRASGQAGWEEGSFFLPGGEQVTGRVYRLGQVAAWGSSTLGSGALAPAGEGRLQLRMAFGSETAAALAAGSPPKQLELQLFEADRGAEEAEKKGGLRQLLNDAGTMGQVLFGLGMLSATLVLSRFVGLMFARRGGQRLVDKVLTRMREGDLAGARAILARRSGPVARVLAAILGASERSKDELERVVDEAILKETPGINRFASALVVITAGSPLLGLLGTVTGMIATFDVITEHGTGNPKLMSAGIAEALVCTALGLAVAIPTLLAGNVLASIGDSVKNTIERAALAALNAIDARREVPVEPPHELTFKAASD